MQTGGTSSPLLNKGKHFERYLQYAVIILTSYRGNEPFHLFLKKYFSSNKKHGSHDRKLISALCFDYFRLGDGVSHEIALPQKIELAAILSETKSSSSSEFFKNPGVTEKEFDAEKIFPFPDELSGEVSYNQLSRSFLTQPKLFIRIRPGFKDIVITKLKKAAFSSEELNENCLAFVNNEKVNSIIDIDKEAVVQDYNSQKTIDLLKREIKSWQPELLLWDCCAGSGGKSILAYDIFGKIKLTVSDRRSNILENLKLRFGKAGISNYELVLTDLQLPLPVTSLHHPFDVIIADVPCTGSGTWSRTPEQLTFFKKKDIESYVALQRKIIENTVPHLGNEGFLLYITCSVFKKENEENVAFIQQKYKLNLLEMQYLKGYEIQADTMFVALFKR